MDLNRSPAKSTRSQDSPSKSRLNTVKSKAPTKPKKIDKAKPSTSKQSVIDEVKLIEKVKQLPALWNSHDDDYKSHIVKQNIWNTIAKDFNVAPDTLKEKWQSLKTGYRQALARASGSRGGKPWKHLQLMSFVKEAKDQIESIKSVPLAEESKEDTAEDDLPAMKSTEPDEEYSMIEEEDDEIGSKRPHSAFDAFSAKKPKLSARERNEKLLTETMVKVLNQPENDKVQEKFLQDASDPISSFFRSLRPDLEKFTDKEMRKFKRGVLDLVEDTLESRDEN